MLILLESLQTQILKSTELLGQKESQLVAQAGEHQLAVAIVMRRDVLADRLLFHGRYEYVDHSMTISDTFLFAFR